MEKTSTKKSKGKIATLSSTNLTQFKLEKNYAKKLLATNLDKLPNIMKEKLENALKLKKCNSSIVNEDYYKSKENWTNSRNASTKPSFVYELIPTDNYEKNNKKTFSVNPEKNLIDTFKIEEILRNTGIPLQEKVKNFDIQFEEKIEEFRNLKNENFHFGQQFSKFYRNGELVDFEPFKTRTENANEIQKIMEKKIFDEIITAYERKNYKIPEFVRKNIFEISPMLVDLRRIKEFYQVPERLRNPNLLKDIKKMLCINTCIKSAGLVNLKEFAEFCEEDFLIEEDKGKDTDKELVRGLKQKNNEEFKGNVKLKDYVEMQAEELKKILENNSFLKQQAEKGVEDDKENLDPNRISKTKNNQNEKPILNKIIENIKTNMRSSLNLNRIKIGNEINPKQNIIINTNNDTNNIPSMSKDKTTTAFEFEDNKQKKIKRESIKADNSNKRESYLHAPIESKMSLEIENISPIRKHKNETTSVDNKENNDLDNSAFECKDFAKLNEVSPEPRKREKCFKTLGSIKKKIKNHPKNINTSNFQEIKLHSLNRESVLEPKQPIFPKAKQMRELLNKAKRGIEAQRELEPKVNEDSNIINLKRIQSFQIFDESNMKEIPKNNRNNNSNNYLNQNNSFNINNQFRTGSINALNEKEVSERNSSNNQNEKIKASIANSSYSLSNRMLVCKSKETNELLKTSSKLASNGVPISATQDSTTVFSSNKRRTNLDSNSQNFTSQFSVSNRKTSGLNTFNNFSVSDFTSKISNELSNLQNTVNNIKLSTNSGNANNNNNEYAMPSNRKDSNFIANSEKNALAINLPKGFKKDLNIRVHKKVLPIKLRNLKNISEFEKLEVKEQIRIPSLIESKANVNGNNANEREFRFEDKITEKLSSENLTNQLEIFGTTSSNINQDLILFKNSEKEQFIDTGKISFKENNTTSEGLEDKKTTGNITNQFESQNKEVYLERLYKRISNKNFHNINRDLNQYVELFANSDTRLKNEMEFLKDKSVEPTKFYNRINSIKSKVKNEDFDDKIANICAENGILNINPGGINKIKKLDKMIFQMDFELVKKLI